MAAGRTRVNGVGRQQKQNKRAATSFQQKLEVIQHYERSHDMQTTVRQFYPELNETERRAKARVVYRWLQLKDAIATHANSAKTKNQSRIRNVGSATTLGAEGERQLVAWLKQMRHAGEQVSSEMLRAKAMQVAKERNVPDGAFAASGTWQKSFLDRNKKFLQDDAEDDGSVSDRVERALSGDVTGNGAVAVSINTITSKQSETSSDEDARPNEGGRNGAEPPQTVVPSVPLQPAKTNTPVQQQRVELNPPPSAAPVVPVTTTQVAAVIPAAPVAVIAEQQIPTPVKIASAESVAAVAPVAAAPTPMVAEQPVSSAVAAAVDSEDREMKKRKAEIEDRKAELLNESIRCDNVLKKIRIAEENMLARKRLRDAGIPQEEIDALLPVQRE